MNRRDTVTALLALGITPRSSFAQRAGKVWRIGILQAGVRADNDKSSGLPFLSGLAELGYDEGRNLIIDADAPPVVLDTDLGKIRGTETRSR